jgi:hypothetical protein
MQPNAFGTEMFQLNFNSCELRARQSSDDRGAGLISRDPAAFARKKGCQAGASRDGRRGRAGRLIRRRHTPR